MTEVCFRDSRKRYLHPVIEWSDADIWQYIRENKLPYCRLYDEGFKRIGCVGCPMAHNRAEEFRRWPAFEKAYRRAFAKAVDALKNSERGQRRVEYSGRNLHWTDGDAMFAWWMQNNRETEDSDQGILFE